MFRRNPAAGVAQAARLAPTARSEITVHEAGSLSDFAALQADWCRLHDSDPDVSVFNSWEWMFHWWKHYGNAQDLHVLVAHAPHCIVGIMPLYLQRQRIAGVALSVLRFVGTGGDTEPDYLGPVVISGDPCLRARIVEALLAHAFDHVPGWDVVELSDLREEADLRTQFAMACVGRRFAGSEEIAAETTYVPLPGTWDGYLDGVGGHRRYTIRSTRRRAEEAHGVRFFVEADSHRVDSALEDLIDLHIRRWEKQGVAHAFSSPEYIGFHRDAVRACAGRGWIRFFGIRSGKRTIASCYCYLWRRQIFYFQAGFDPACEKMRPGLVMIGYALEHAIGEGLAVFDFLRGGHPYKRQWGKGVRTTYVCSAFRGNIAASLHRLRHGRLQRARSWLGRCLRRRSPWIFVSRTGE
jgi:CelD/BcsL family acetyltransferase involved in cellulose biosynthesis